MARFSKTWRCPGAVGPRKKEGLKEWALRDIEWACKLGKSVDDDDKCIAWLREKKNIKASKVKGSEGWLYNFGNHWVRFWRGEHWHTRDAYEGDFFVVFTNGTFALMSWGQFQMLEEKIKIRKLDEKLAGVANPFGIDKVAMRRMAESGIAADNKAEAGNVIGDGRKPYKPVQMKVYNAPWQESEVDPNEGD